MRKLRQNWAETMIKLWQICVETVAKLHWNWAETVVKTCLSCGNVIKLCWNCYETGLKLWRNCGETGLKLWRNCGETGLKLWWNCGETTVCWNCCENILKLWQCDAGEIEIYPTVVVNRWWNYGEKKMTKLRQTLVHLLVNFRWTIFMKPGWHFGVGVKVVTQSQVKLG